MSEKLISMTNRTFVRAIADGFSDGQRFVTKGKEYEVLSVGPATFTVVDDLGEQHKFFREGSKFFADDSYYGKEPIGFGEAIAELEDGRRICRVGWNGKGMWLKLIRSDMYEVHSADVCREADDVLPWIGMKTADGKFVPWLASQTDILAKDWMIIL